jgi:hypothetical protein
MPFELRPVPHPTLRPEGDYLQRAWQQSVYPIARRMGVEIKLPPAAAYGPVRDSRQSPFGDHGAWRLACRSVKRYNIKWRCGLSRRGS